ncbi:xanthine dehydrogenase family protein subunit M [Alteribacillus sp. YIM 98480]|uniref:FAD binding domain-containing protein n=1 Tax=Alteribacillus sp. YIM 98480 TaxID=2606599 RepID=UPI00131B572A|nr:xanthine dehydrogenase family protein subunit M [Alteribacillus sp. YIM 98480]
MGDTLWLEPEKLSEVKDILSSGDPEIRVVSGGTALSLIMKQGMFDPNKIVSLKKLQSELRYITSDKAGNVRIGSMTTLRDLEVDALIKEKAPVLSEALTHVANPRIRYVASIGGNLSHGDAHLDMPPILMAMGAEVKIESAKGDRWLDLKEFFKGYYETAIEPDEILTEIMIPKQAEGIVGTYIKYTTLSNDDWPTVGVAAFLKKTDGIAGDSRIVISAATDIPTQLFDVQHIIDGNQLDKTTIQKAAEKAFEVAEPLEDLRGSVWYKKEMVKVHVRKALEQLAKE